MMRAVRFHSLGGPNVLRVEQVPKPQPADNEVLVRVKCSGINFLDIYQRTGLYKVDLPSTPGTDAAGIVEQIGSHVSRFRLGDRVAFFSRATNAEFVAVPEDKTVRIPDDVGFDVATACMVQGLTAHYLAHDAYHIKKGDTVLVHAAAGGTGQMLTQIAKIRGARVIGTVGSPEKVPIIKSLGVDEAILYKQQDVEAEVKRLTNGKGVNAVYDGVGKDTWEKSINCCAIRGTVVFFGNSSGPVPPFSPLLLSKASLTVTRPTLAHFVQTAEELDQRISDLFGWLREGKLKVAIHKRFPLDEIEKAHIEIESGKTLGKIILEV